jgi:hypothetical protein
LPQSSRMAGVRAPPPTCPSGHRRRIMKVLLLCGGSGMRMRDPSDAISRPMVTTIGPWAILGARWSTTHAAGARTSSCVWDTRATHGTEPAIGFWPGRSSHHLFQDSLGARPMAFAVRYLLWVDSSASRGRGSEDPFGRRRSERPSKTRGSSCDTRDVIRHRTSAWTATAAAAPTVSTTRS